jgi:hypothetical protein
MSNPSSSGSTLERTAGNPDDGSFLVLLMKVILSRRDPTAADSQITPLTQNS